MRKICSHCGWLVFLILAVVVVFYVIPLPEYRFVGAGRSLFVVGLIMVSPLVARRALGKPTGKPKLIVRRGIILACYLTLVIAVFPWIASGYYIANDLTNQKGAFSTFVFSRYGHHEKVRQKQKDDAIVEYEVIEYGGTHKKHGKQTWMSRNGQLLGEETWELGMLHGPFILYDVKSGSPSFVGNYRRGLKDGDWQKFNDDGKLCVRVTFEQGKPIESTRKFYDNLGRVVSKSEYELLDTTLPGKTEVFGEDMGSK